MKFNEWPKMARFSRSIIITEKIDGTNSSIFIQDASLEEAEDSNIIAIVNGFSIRAGSRTRWITPTKNNDNYGFAKWVFDNKEELVTLGEGHHFGEWWGSGIQRNYGLSKGERIFSLFNTHRWSENRPSCCSVVPVLYEGEFDTQSVQNTIDNLATNGSFAMPGFMNPEGIIIYHTAANIGFKKTIKDDEIPKSKVGK